MAIIMMIIINNYNDNNIIIITNCNFNQYNNITTANTKCNFLHTFCML